MGAVLVVRHVLHLSAFQHGREALDGPQHAFVLRREVVFGEQDALVGRGPDPDALVRNGVPGIHEFLHLVGLPGVKEGQAAHALGVALLLVDEFVVREVVHRPLGQQRGLVTVLREGFRKAADGLELDRHIDLLAAASDGQGQFAVLAFRLFDRVAKVHERAFVAGLREILHAGHVMAELVRHREGAPVDPGDHVLQLEFSVRRRAFEEMLHSERQAFQGRPRAGGAQVDQIARHLLVRSGLGRFGPPVAVVLLDRTELDAGKREKKHQERKRAGGQSAGHVNQGYSGPGHGFSIDLDALGWLLGPRRRW